MSDQVFADLTGMRVYSVDLRQRIVAAVQSGQSQKAVAERLAVSTATVCRFLRWHQEREGDLSPRRPPGAARRIADVLLSQVAGHLAQHSDTTLQQMRSWLADQHGVAVSVATIHRALRRQGRRFKKSRWWPASKMKKSGLPSAQRSKSHHNGSSLSMNRAAICR